MQNTVQHSLTTFFLSLITSVDVFHVVAESDCAENERKYYTHETHIDQLLNIKTYGFENVAYFWVVTENIHDVDEVERRVEEGSYERYNDVDCYSPELST